MRNIEIKVRCPDPESVRRAAERLGARDAGWLEQDDTFFPAPEGRLKLRDFGNETAELIAYRRPDTPEAKGSDYLICETAQPERLRSVLTHALGEGGRVRKRRRLLLYQHTRIHLDEVEGLGSFVELETVISDQSDAEAHAELREIAAALGLAPEDRIAAAYVDLLRERDADTTPGAPRM